MTDVVLDSSAVLAVMQEEPGNDVVLPFLENALVSTINIAEVVTRFARKGLSENLITAAIKKLPIQACAFSQELVPLTGMLVQQTQQYGLSLGDRACLALGLTKNLPVLTADRVWSELRLPIEVRLIR